MLRPAHLLPAIAVICLAAACRSKSDEPPVEVPLPADPNGADAPATSQTPAHAPSSGPGRRAPGPGRPSSPASPASAAPSAEPPSTAAPADASPTAPPRATGRPISTQL